MMFSFLGINTQLFEFQQLRMRTTEGDTPVDAYVALVVAFLMSGGPITSDNRPLDKPGRWSSGPDWSSRLTRFTRADHARIKRELASWSATLPGSKAGKRRKQEGK